MVLNRMSFLWFSSAFLVVGGQLLEEMNKVGVSNLITEVLKQGTKNKTPQELEEEIEMLGASIFVRSDQESITITANTLARNYQKTLDIVKEIILEPRWDSEEFELAKTKTINGLKRMLG
jgi:zinc protease